MYVQQGYQQQHAGYQMDPNMLAAYYGQAAAQGYGAAPAQYGGHQQKGVGWDAAPVAHAAPQYEEIKVGPVPDGFAKHFSPKSFIPNPPDMPNVPPLIWLSLPAGATRSKLVEKGMSAQAPALIYEKGEELFGLASGMQTEWIWDSEVEIVHDNDWSLFPDVGPALVEAGVGEKQYAVAFCNRKNLWAVGAGGKSHRVTAARLALAVAFARDEPWYIPRALGNCPGFSEVLCQLGLMVGLEGLVPTETSETLRQMGVFSGKNDKEWQKEVFKERLEARGGEYSKGPTLVWITMPALCGLDQLGFEHRAPAVSWCKGDPVFQSSPYVLTDILGDMWKEIRLYDDHDWSIFPDVGEACKMAGADECSLMLAHARCGQTVKWGVGLGSKGRRENAAKLALAISIAHDIPSYQNILAKYPEFALLCSADPATPVYPMPDGVSEDPAAKKARVEE